MASTSSRNRCHGGALHGSGVFTRSLSPTGRFFSGAGNTGRFSSPTGVNSAFASSSATAFSVSPASTFASRCCDFSPHRSASPTRINLVGSPRSRSLEQIASKSRPISPAAPPRKTCMCSPTNHPGSFRCSLHKGLSSPHSVSSPSNRLNARRSAMTNSLVRIGTVEGEWVKRALTALIRPSSHQQRRRAAFKPRPSRLSVMSKADDLETKADE